MALVACKECGKEISGEAKICPHCGKKAKKGVSCIMMIGMVLAFIMFLAMAKACSNIAGGSSASTDRQAVVSEKNKAGAAVEKSKSGESDKAEHVEQAKIGDSVQVGDFVYQVKEIAFAKKIGNEMTGKTADGVFLLIDLNVKNTGNKSATIDNSLFKLTDEAKTQYESSTEGTTALEMNGVNTLFLKQCQPGIATSGVLVFEVPEEKVYDLELSGGMWSGKTANVKLAAKVAKSKKSK